MPTTGVGAALILSASGASASATLLITGKGDFTNVIEVDLAVSVTVNFAVDSARLLIVGLGDGWIGASAARNV